MSDFEPGTLPGDRKPRAGDNPPLPLADTHTAKVDALYAWYLELIALDGLPADEAARKAISAAVPGTPDRAVTVGGKILATAIALILLAFLIPAVLWGIGNIIMPWWRWGVAWL